MALPNREFQSQPTLEDYRLLLASLTVLKSENARLVIDKQMLTAKVKHLKDQKPTEVASKFDALKNTVRQQDRELKESRETVAALTKQNRALMQEIERLEQNQIFQPSSGASVVDVSMFPPFYLSAPPPASSFLNENDLFDQEEANSTSGNSNIIFRGP